jgi:hypothetical protein
VQGVLEMTTRLQQVYAEGQMSQMDCRNVNLLTVLSKLMVALMMGIVAIIFTVMS